MRLGIELNHPNFKIKNEIKLIKDRNCVHVLGSSFLLKFILNIMKSLKLYLKLGILILGQIMFIKAIYFWKFSFKYYDAI